MWQDRCVKTLVISIILLIIVGILKFLFPTPLMDEELAEERFWALKTFAKPEFDMLVMGDSRTFCGISPDAMNTILPSYRILNFGYSLGGLNEVIYREATAKLDPNSNKKVLLLAVTPSSLLPETAKNLAFQEKKTMSREYVYILTNFYQIAKFLSPLKVEDMIPFQLQKIIRKILKKDTSERHYTKFHDNGWVAAWRIPETKRYLKDFHDMFLENHISDNLVQKLLEKTQEWVQQGILVFGFRPPSSVEMEALENELSGFDEGEFSKKFETAGGIWLSFPVERYHSYDASHLHKDSAVQFSKDLAIQIKKHLANSY